MGSHCKVFILVYVTVVLLQIVFITSTPLPSNRLYQRSINPQTIYSSPTGSNYLEDWSKSRDKAKSVQDVQRTIAEVQRILETDPTLPRLTTGEIEDLFEAVTKEEYQKSIKAGDLSRAKHMRALMLVLPYNVNQSSENDLQELYNRPPITKMISNEKEERKQKIVVPSGKVEIVNIAKQVPTTYKPNFRTKPLKTIADPTTYRPNPTVKAFTTLKHTNVPPFSSKISSIRSSTTTPPSFESLFEPNRRTFSTPYNSEIIGNDAPFKPIPIPTNSKSIDPELEDILMHLGFAEKSQSKKRFKLDEPPPEELSKRMLSSVIRQDSIPDSYPYHMPSVPTFSADEFTKGLGPSMSARDYDAFKPIPEPTGNIPADLENYLKEFGLFPPFEERNKKAMKVKTTSQISSRIDDGAIEFRDKSKKSKTIRDTFSPKDPIPTKNTFKPIVDPDQEDYQKLQDLLHTLRELQKLNASLSEDVLSKLDPRHFNLSQTLLSQGPNPVLEPEFDLSKNEIKRQTDSPEPIKVSLDLNADDNTSTAETPETTESTITTTSTFAPNIQAEIDNIFVVTPEPDPSQPAATTSSSTTTTTEEAPRNNLADLGDSFAGGLGSADNAEPLPPPRKNGFYFLLDVNKFLEVGEDPDKIVVRFDPKVGDPSRFIPVNVP